MNSVSLSRTGWVRKSANLLLLFVLETMVFAIITLSPYLSIHTLLYVHAGLTAALLVAALSLRRTATGKPYWPVVYAFFVAAMAVLLSALFSDDLLGLFGLTPTSPQGIAAAKFSESILRVIPILALMAASGDGWRSMYLGDYPQV